MVFFNFLKSLIDSFKPGLRLQGAEFFSNLNYYLGQNTSYIIDNISLEIDENLVYLKPRISDLNVSVGISNIDFEMLKLIMELEKKNSLVALSINIYVKNHEVELLYVKPYEFSKSNVYSQRKLSEELE